MTNSIDAIPSDQLRITVEIGDDCRTTPRLAAALRELHGAVEEADGTEVQGFALDDMPLNTMVSSFSWATNRSPGIIRGWTPKGEVVAGEFKF